MGFRACVCAASNCFSQTSCRKCDVATAVLEKWREKNEKLFNYFSVSIASSSVGLTQTTCPLHINCTSYRIDCARLSSGERERMLSYNIFPNAQLQNPKWQNGIDKNIFIESIFIFHLLAY